MKYIEAERLRAEIESIKLFPQISADYNDGREDMKMAVFDIIDSLQQEQSESTNGKFTFPNFLYARTLDNKTIDVSYGPQSLDAVEYIRNDSIQQEQESVAERFARIVRGNLIGIDKEVQHKFEQLYFEVTGNKMYGGYND